MADNIDNISNNFLRKLFRKYNGDNRVDYREIKEDALRVTKLYARESNESNVRLIYALNNILRNVRKMDEMNNAFNVRQFEFWLIELYKQFQVKRQ